VIAFKHLSVSMRPSLSDVILRRLDTYGVTVSNVAVGSTPTCSYPADDLEGVTELHPGNYIVYGTSCNDRRAIIAFFDSNQIFLSVSFGNDGSDVDLRRYPCGVLDAAMSPDHKRANSTPASS
jgi:hypothetical protein